MCIGGQRTADQINFRVEARASYRVKAAVYGGAAAGRALYAPRPNLRPLQRVRARAPCSRGFMNRARLRPFIFESLPLSCVPLFRPARCATRAFFLV